MGIRNIRHKGLKQLYLTGSSAKLGARYVDNALLILDHLAAIADIKDCNGVKNFHPLTGNRADEYSMHVTGNYVITFKWDGHDVYDVNFEDYH